MTKDDLTKEVCDRTGLPYLQVKKTIEATIDSIIYNVTHNEPIYLRGFGTFDTKLRAEKKAQNITKGETMTIPAHHTPHFKPADFFKEETIKCSKSWKKKK